MIKIRASQINSCAYCIDMHTRDATEFGETEQGIYSLKCLERIAPVRRRRERIFGSYGINHKYFGI